MAIVESTRTQAVAFSALLRRYTLEELWALPEPQDRAHYELIGGVLYVVPPPGWSHNLAAARLLRLLSRYQDAHPDRCTLFVPRAAVWTPRDTYLEPDLFLVSAETLATTDADQLTTADLVVEIHAPAPAMYDRTTKADTYAALGVRELWLVDLDRRTIEQRVLASERWTIAGTYAGGDAVESAVFPGLRVLPAEIFG